MAMKVYEGQLNVAGLRIALVVARFNELITDRLLDGAVGAWRRLGGDESQLEVARVAGAFELPQTSKVMAESGRYDAVICLGCVIRGATSHYDYVCAQAAAGIMQVGLATGIPVIFGVLTTDTLEQAQDRAGAKSGNKGADAMLTALESVNLYKSLRDTSH
jgi:6,7-dimethyl-8-ribityllumazine synthase